MSKWQTFKTYVKNPPAELITKIEVQGHFLSILGVLVASIILFINGLWYVSLAFVFSILVSWAQGMAALARYRIFKGLLPKETFEYILMDSSFTRRRSRLFKKVFPWYLRWILLPLCFALTILIIGIHPITVDFRWKVYGFTVLAWSNYFIEVALLTLITWFIFKFVVIAGIIQHKKIKELKNGREENKLVS